MRRVFAVLATLQALVIVAQFFLAASGAFDTAPIDQSFQPHRGLGYGIIFFAILLTIVAALARMPGRLIGMTALVAGLGVVQSLIRRTADAFNTGDNSTTAGQLIFGLHAVNGLIILAVAVTVARQAQPRTRRHGHDGEPHRQLKLHTHTVARRYGSRPSDGSDPK